MPLALLRYAYILPLQHKGIRLLVKTQAHGEPGCVGENRSIRLREGQRKSLREETGTGLEHRLARDILRTAAALERPWGGSTQCSTRAARQCLFRVVRSVSRVLAERLGQARREGQMGAGQRGRETRKWASLCGR